MIPSKVSLTSILVKPGWSVNHSHLTSKVCHKKPRQWFHYTSASLHKVRLKQSSPLLK